VKKGRWYKFPILRSRASRRKGGKEREGRETVYSIIISTGLCRGKRKGGITGPNGNLSRIGGWPRANRRGEGKNLVTLTDPAEVESEKM